MAWQTRERGLQLSRTPHARSSCIIVKFRTIAWRTQILASDSRVRSYDGRTVSVEWSLRRANCKRFTHIRPTDGSGSRPVSGVGERLSMAVHGQTSDAQRSGGFNVFWFSSFYSFEFLLKTKHSTVNCQPLRSFSRVKAVGDRLLHQQTHANDVTCTGSFRIRPKNMRLTSHCRAEYRAGTPCDSFCFPQRTANHRALESDAWP